MTGGHVVVPALRAQVCDEPRVRRGRASIRSRRPMSGRATPGCVVSTGATGDLGVSAAWPDTSRRPRFHEREAPMSERLISSVQCADGSRPSPRSRRRRSARSSSRPGRRGAEEAPTAVRRRRRERHGGAAAHRHDASCSASSRTSTRSTRTSAWSPRRTRPTSSCTTTSRRRSDKDFSPAARARRAVGDLGGRQDLDVPHPPGRQVVRRSADLTAKDVAYTFQRAHRRRDRERPVRQLRRRHREGHRDRRRHRGHGDDGAQPRCMLRLAVPILPEHIWKDIDAKAVATFANDKTPVGSGPFRLVEARTGQFYRFAANKSYWAGAPKIDELVLRIFADDEAMVAGAQQGEIDMVQDISPATFESLKNEPGITVSSSKYSGFNELAYNLGAATTDDKADRRRPPGAAGQAGPARARPRDRPQDAGREGDAATTATAGHRRHPADLPAVALEPAAGDERAFDLAKANRSSTRPATRRAPTASGSGKDGKRKLKFRLFGRERARSSRRRTSQYIRDWFKEIGVDGHRLDHVRGPAHRRSSARASTTCSTGAGSSSPTRTSSCRCSPAASAPTRTAARSRPAGRTASTATRPTTRSTTSRRRSSTRRRGPQVVKQMQTACCTTTRCTRCCTTTTTSRPTAATGSPNLVRQPTDGGSLVFQYGTYTYRNIDAGDRAGAGVRQRHASA